MNTKTMLRWVTGIGMVVMVLFGEFARGDGAPVADSEALRFYPASQPIVMVPESVKADQKARLQVWSERGIRFKGAWQPEEMALVLDVLDGFGEMMGEERLVALLDTAVRDQSFGFKRYLTLVRKPSWGLPAAVWYALRGQVVLNDSLFDAQFVYENYSWSFLHGPYVTLPRQIAMQEAIIGHEIGHVLIDGLHAEAHAMGDRDLSLEALYQQTVAPVQWPHAGYVANENLATELAVWALGIVRTPEVDALRTQLRPRLGHPVALGQ